ncbi:MAG: S1 family peptidase [Myxococcales bacterium]|nr:S1 family peptidase [Myxococcales bacterium]
MSPFAPALLVPWLAFAPGGDAPDSLASPPEVSQIVGGEQTGELEYGAIVALLNSQSGLCTGTVVTPRLVLTAAHCVSNLGLGSSVDVYYGNELDFNMSTEAVGFGFHPEFCDDCREDIYDYGYVLLGTDFTPPDGFIMPITDQEEWDQVMQEGHEVILVGFGEDPEAINPADSLGTKRKVTTTISRFSELGLEFFAGGDDKDSCQGDSGGPAIVRLSDGTLRLAGITSRGSDPCGKGGFYGAPFPALSWVRDEVGVDLLPAGCEDGDCIDMTPPAEDEGRCSVAGRPSWRGALWLLLPLGWVRRRARASRP